ncbi:LysR family transcriptional regulator [Haliea sp. E1-2-M8]|uniref:LysR family transcriptional regulator n=1 Tax=Haliea sp. E1-2-M8 TaxID=3064706 RepID=UPI0027260817|nr:LysR family transcriptional regulator [Haliea sp. E1-2-M8]MDO8863146.1 LysR family transcriptional regulator [Haliea sp. E1-2-M8]
MGRWEYIEEFICVVETGSFTNAAERLDVSKSFISKQVSRLEDRLQARLLQRSTRRLTLTEAGEVFYRYCKSMADNYAEAESALSEMLEGPRGTLKIAINSRYGVHYMANVVAAFSHRHPELSVEVHSSFHDVDIIQGGFDLNIRYGKLEDSSMIARKLGCYSLCLCASPEYFEEWGVPQTPEDLQSHNCLTPPERYWLFNTRSPEPLKVKVHGNWLSEDGATLLAAAREGIGLVQLPDFYVEDSIRKGRLMKLNHLPWSRYERETWAVYPHTRHLSAKVRYFMDFFSDYIKTQLRPHRSRFVSH